MKDILVPIFPEQLVDAFDKEPKLQPLNKLKARLIVPLQMEFDRMTPDSRIIRRFRLMLKQKIETEFAYIIINCVSYTSDGQDRMNGFEIRHTENITYQASIIKYGDP